MLVCGPWSEIHRGRVLIQRRCRWSAVLGAIGVLSILMGLLAEMLNRTSPRSQAKPVYRVGRVVRSGVARQG